MFVRKGLLGAIGLAVLAMGIQRPVQAQTVVPSETASVVESVSASEQVNSRLTLDELAANDPETADLSANEIESAAWMSPENLSAEGLDPADDTASAQAQPSATDIEATTLDSPNEESAQLAQARRRTTRGIAGSSNFLGIGADFGTTDDISFAVISKYAFSDQVAVRPSVLIGDGFAVLVPITYEFSRYSTDVQGFQIRPYAGVGASYVDSDVDDSFGLLLSGGVDVPISQRFTANAQANFAGVFSDDSNFGVTVGVGYNFGGFR